MSICSCGNVASVNLSKSQYNDDELICQKCCNRMQNNGEIVGQCSGQFCKTWIHKEHPTSRCSSCLPSEH